VVTSNTKLMLVNFESSCCIVYHLVFKVAKKYFRLIHRFAIILTFH